MQIKSTSVILFLLIVLNSCKHSALTAQEIEQYIAEPSNGLVITQKTLGADITASYLPTDLLALREFLTEQIPSNKEFLNASNKYRNSQYFVISFSVDDHEVLNPAAGINKYGELLRTISFGMQRYVHLTTADGDTLQPLSYSLDRTYAMGSSTQVLFAFPKKPKAEWIRVNVQEFGLGSGNVTFQFQQSDIQNTPSLKLQ